MIELHREPLVLLPPSFSTRRLLDECFASAGAEPSVVAETNTVAAMLGMVARLPVGAIAAASAVTPNPALRLIPMESPTPMRTPGLLFRSEEHTSELQSLMRISYAVFCLKKKKNKN